MPTASADRNLLFGVVVLQGAYIDNNQFAEIRATWATRKATPLADLLIERSWLTAADKKEVERAVERHLQRHGGHVQASLQAVADSRVRRSLAAVPDDRRAAIVGRVGVGRSPGCPGDGPPVRRCARSGERYSLSHVHGVGGIGRVWLARDASLGNHVALKELRPERAGDRLRFVEEARITGQLDHPNIVPVHELSQHQADVQLFYTMRFVRGRMLGEAIQEYHRRRAAGEAGCWSTGAC